MLDQSGPPEALQVVAWLQALQVCGDDEVSAVHLEIAQNVEEVAPGHLMRILDDHQPPIFPAVLHPPDRMHLDVWIRAPMFVSSCPAGNEDNKPLPSLPGPGNCLVGLARAPGASEQQKDLLVRRGAPGRWRCQSLGALHRSRRVSLQPPACLLALPLPASSTLL